MAKTIYNEGRVVGLSSHEIYVKEALGEFPDIEPATEREWLASSLGSGASLLYRMPQTVDKSEIEEWILEFDLPGDSRLGAANTIVASWFDGEAEIDSQGWATKVTSYGDLIVNDASLTGKESSKSKTNNISWSEDKIAKFKGFMKIVDGVVIQPGTWTATGGAPVNDFSPDLNEKPFIRLKVKGNIDKPFFILFTGFTIRTVLAGTTGLDGSTATYRPDDGDFLGPAIYPWANKIIFSLPTSYTAEFELSKYTRNINSEGDLTVADTAVVDMRSAQFATAFQDKLDSTVDLNVKEYMTLGEGESVLTVYAKSSQYIPALWATYVTAVGDTKLYPVDIVAPGSVKMFQNGTAEEMKAYEETYPRTFTESRTDKGEIYTLNKDGQIVPAAIVTHKDIKNSTNTKIGTAVVLQAGDNKEIALSMGAGGTETQYTITTQPSTNTDVNYIRISDILTALKDNKGLDILGSRLINAKTTLVDKKYLEFGTGSNIKRLYISSTAPTDTDIPDGSIGIGWGFGS